jgi:pSer/pThr/pTyr-binding forkhead associated (FHA) protein
VIQLKILSGNKAGTVWVARHFPVRIGRSPHDDLQLEEPGVWQDHLRLEFLPAEGFILRPGTDSPVALNSAALTGPATLRNGDTIELGSARLRFWLADSRQARFWFREWITWAGIAAISLAQIALIYWLLR